MANGHRQLSEQDFLFARPANYYLPRLARCEAAPTVVVRTGSLLSFQQFNAHNYGHFMQQSLPMLLLALSTPGLPADVSVLAYTDEPFQLHALRALGLTDSRVLAFDPCVVHRSEALYMVVHNGHGVPSRFIVRAARAALLPPPIATAAVTPSSGSAEEANAPTAGGDGTRYALLIDRGDRHSTTERRARTLTNGVAVRHEIEAALRPAGIELRLLRASELSLVEQIEQVANAHMLVGVHGAGLASGLFLPANSALLELLPRRAVNNQLHPGCELQSHCGYTQFWYVAATLRKVRYYALVLHGYAWWDAVHVTPGVVGALTRRICKQHGGAKWKVQPHDRSAEEALLSEETLS